MELTKRPRRLRGSENLRKMVRETRMDKSSLMYPMFVMEGENKEEEIPSMTGQYRYSLDRLPYKLEQLSKAGIATLLIGAFCSKSLIFPFASIGSPNAFTTRPRSP